MYWILPVILAAVVLFLTFAYNQNNRPDITAYDLSAPGAPACTVVHLSDLHSQPKTDKSCTECDQCSSCEPDSRKPHRNDLDNQKQYK